MTRGRTLRGRSRERAATSRPVARPLLTGEDQGDPILVDAGTVGAAGDRWIEPFLRANESHLRRLDLKHDVDARDGLRIRLFPGPKIGAIPLLSPSTRRVVAGLLVRPRFRWTALGEVFEAIGFGVEPALGGAPLVPGSAREVPPWMIAGSVLGRLEQLLRHRKRVFVERCEERASPRGRVEWSEWASRQLVRGAWHRLPCSFSEPDDDPELFAGVRWTLARLADSLAPQSFDHVAHSLLQRIALLLNRVGPGVSRRPKWGPLIKESAWVLEAKEAMGWVAEQRGLGGSRSLDGICWDLSVDQVWEAWVDSFASLLAPRLGLTHVSRGATSQPLNWHSGRRSMRSLVPDVVLRGGQRIVWIDAKYKAHLELIGSRGWDGLSEEVRASHRSDLHQALAYAALADVEQVDTVLAYPHLAADGAVRHAPVATIASGRRRVRLILAGVPFGFHSPDRQEAELSLWRHLLAA